MVFYYYFTYSIRTKKILDTKIIEVAISVILLNSIHIFLFAYFFIAILYVHACPYVLWLFVVMATCCTLAQLLLLFHLTKRGGEMVSRRDRVCSSRNFKDELRFTLKIALFQLLSQPNCAPLKTLKIGKVSEALSVCW